MTPPSDRRRHALRWFVAVLVLLAVAWVATQRVRYALALSECAVRVVDPQGRPVSGVSIDGTWRCFDLTIRHRCLGATDDEGQLLLAFVTENAGSSLVGDLWVQPELAGFTGAFRRVEDQTEFEVPETTRLEVVVVGSDGEPWRDPALVRYGAEVRWGIHGAEDGEFSHRYRDFDSEGHVVFDSVASGVDLQILASVQGVRIDRTVRTSDQHAAAGPIVLQIPDSARILTGRVLQPGGEVWNGEFSLSITASSGSSSVMMKHWTGYADESGVFRFLLDGGFPEQGQICIETEERARGKGEFDGVRDGRLDVGDLQLEPASPSTR